MVGFRGPVRQTVVASTVGISSVIVICMAGEPTVVATYARPIVVVVCRPVRVAPARTPVFPVVVMAFSRPVPRAMSIVIVPSVSID